MIINIIITYYKFNLYHQQGGKKTNNTNWEKQERHLIKNIHLVKVLQLTPRPIGKMQLKWYAGEVSSIHIEDE